jgi:hypothetical protein
MLGNEKRSAVTTADLRFAQKSQDQPGLVGAAARRWNTWSLDHPKFMVYLGAVGEAPLGALVGLPPPQPTREAREVRQRARARTDRIRFIEDSSVSVTTTLRE